MCVFCVCLWCVWMCLYLLCVSVQDAYNRLHAAIQRKATRSDDDREGKAAPKAAPKAGPRPEEEEEEGPVACDGGAAGQPVAVGLS